MITKEQKIKQLKCIILYEFLQTYCMFENKIKDCFKESLNSISAEVKQKLYFIYGSQTRTYIEYYPIAIKSTGIKYKNDETFNQLTINQILNFDKKEHFIKSFNIKINSLQTKITEYEFHDSAIKLIEMRNILAHELKDPNFKEKHIIEILSDENIKKNITKYSIDFVGDVDLNLMDDVSKTVISNYIYMKLLMEEIG